MPSRHVHMHIYANYVLRFNLSLSQPLQTLKENQVSLNDNSLIFYHVKIKMYKTLNAKLLTCFKFFIPNSSFGLQFM